MTISDSEKIDFLWKKVIYGTSKTANALVKSGSNETVASPEVVFSTSVWTQTDSTSIPTTPPSSNSATIAVYYGAQRIVATTDPTSPANVTWLTGMTNFIPPTFGPQYLVRVFVGDPQSTGVRIFPDTTGFEYVFDYTSGTLNFDSGIPANVSTNGVYIQAYQYIGTNLSDALASIGDSSKTSVVADITARNALTPNAGDIAHVLDANGDPANAGPGEFADYLWTGSSWQCIATQASARTDALTQHLDIISDNFADSSDLIGTVGNGTRVVEVSIEVLSAFDSGDITIGDASVNDRLLSSDEVDLQTTGIYIVNPAYQFPSGADVDVNIYYSGTPGSGSATVTITWA